MLRRAILVSTLLMIPAIPCRAAGLADAMPATERPADQRALSETPTYLVRVPLPITGTIDLQLKQTLEAIAMAPPSKAPPEGEGEVTSRGATRPTVILEFNDATQGRGSQFERSVALARTLTDPRLGRLRLVAYLGDSVYGHAVLPVLACEQIVAHPDAELGHAGADESLIDVTMQSAYRDLAERRRTLPVAVVLAMLDPSLVVSRVQTASGIRYALADELAQWQQRGEVLESQTLDTADRPLVLTGRSMRVDHGFVSQLASDRHALAAAVGVSSQAIQTPWSAIRPQAPLWVRVNSSERSELRRIRRMVEQARLRRSVDWICFEVNSSGGAPMESVDLASYITNLAHSGIHSVALISAEARSDAALIALFCDEVFMLPTAMLGGSHGNPADEKGAVGLPAAEREAALEVVRELAEQKQRRWSVAAAMLDSQFPLAQYVHRKTGAREILCEQELQTLHDQDQWQRDQDLWQRDPSELMNNPPLELSGPLAEKWGIARLIQNTDELSARYGISQPIAVAKPNWAEELIAALASPQISAILLFVAVFALMAELSAPGTGLGGFVATICFTLFFWSNFLNGTAGWLEVLLFGMGCIFVLLEIFLLPGFGLFGVGGGALILLSLVLASQTFVIPHNQYELSQLPRSLATVAIFIAGVVVGLAALRHLLPTLPGFRQFMLQPPNEETWSQLHERESLVHYENLLGKSGVTATRLAPAGKANFGDGWVDVLSDGEVIESGQAIQVISVTGNCIVVRRA